MPCAPCARRQVTEINMKKLPIAAAALLFGTSAYAMIPPSEPTGVMVQKDPYVVTPTAEPVTAGDEAWAFQPATENWWTDKSDNDHAGFKTVADTSDAMKAADKADAKLAADDTDADRAVAPEKKAHSGAADEAATLQPAALETGFAADGAAQARAEDSGGMGVETAAAAAAPRAAAQNYPACRPGRGDDRCIQLYEPGVQAQLASWTQPTGGFAGTADTQVAMGGPYEPADDSATATEQLNRQALAASSAAVQTAAADSTPATGDDTIDTAMAETADDETVGEA